MKWIIGLIINVGMGYWYQPGWHWYTFVGFIFGPVLLAGIISDWLDNKYD